MRTLVTGAAGGIGRRVATALADAGHQVVAADLSPAVAEVGPHAVFDVADREACRAAVDEHGPFDALVSCAAIVDQVHSAASFPPDGWERELSVNLSGPFWLAQAVAPGMAERGFGRIVVISSGAAEAGLPGQVAYAASKAGLLGMVRTLAVELGRSGVTVNAILPGLIETEKVAAMPEGIKERVVGRTALGRAGSMDEVAALVAHLCSEEGGYITGACIPIDGGGGLNTLTLTR
jgi:NAD(P)-dependent dehydrogenase (short-subunit alcohol dehydrogenase family)